MTAAQHALTAQASDAAIDTACRMLRLPTMRAQAADTIARAEREGLSYAGFLAELLLAECEDRDRRRAERRIRAAHFPREKSLREFDYTANPNVDPAVIHSLATCDWITKGYPLCLIGDSGNGKSHLLIGLGTAAVMAGYRVRYTTAASLVNELVEAADDKQLGKPSPATAASTCWKSTNSATSNSTAAARRCSSRFRPSARRRTASPSPPTRRSPAGQRRSPIRGSARPSWTGSPSTPP